jgi:hypothetical protein
MNGNINIDISNLNNIIEEYNNNTNLYELELVYNYNISEKILKKLVTFLNKKQVNNSKNVSYILDISLVNDKNHRLSIKNSKSDVINSHCLFEKEHMENNKIFPENYVLEYKELESKTYLNELNSRLNLKKEFIETAEVKNEFIDNYNKFKKTYRFKKRITYVYDNYNVDISLVKQSSGQNILLSNIGDVLEKIELEIEFTGETLTKDILKEMLNLMVIFNQYNNEGYFNIDKNEKIEINKSYSKLIQTVIKGKQNSKIGPKPLTFTKNTIKNMLDVFEKEKDGKLHYKITEKADGERYFMYIDKLNIVYLIGNDNNVLKTGLKLNNNTYSNSILDGELLYYKTDKYIYNYKYFDIYILNNKEVFSNDLNARINLMNKLDVLLEKANKYISEDLYIKCESKPYYEINELTNILDQPERPYSIDGIIYMPSIHLSNIDNKSYKYILKYKPLEENTIDVLVENKKLYCGYNIKDDYVKSEIMCIKPYIVDIHKKEIKRKINEDLELVDYDLINNKIVEVVYDIENDCFIYKKIRHDKTEEYIKTGRITANNFYIVNEILEYTFNNIDIENMKNLSVDYIENMLKITNKNGYYKTNQISKTNNSEKKLRSLQNKIKSMLINDAIGILENNENFTYIKTLDLACGRGGDILKYINTNFIDNNNNNKLKKTGGIKFILGIDSSSVNIEYTEKYNNNARGRYIQHKNEYTGNIMPELYKDNTVYYITGDLNLYNETNNVEESYISIMNNVKYTDNVTNELLDNNNDFEERTTYDKKILDSLNLYEKNYFEFINCQFAIHYFDLDKFCKYVDLHLKPGGIFVCTFMEKTYVNKLLNNKNVVSGKFWSIKKSTTDPENKIDVKFDTLEGDNYVEENLISEEQIVEAFEKYNINLYVDTMSEIIAMITSIDPVVNFRDYIKETDPEFEFNKLYKGLIFQKTLQSSEKVEKIKAIIK